VTFARKGHRPLALAVWMASLAIAFFVFYHFHTYYLFPLAPPAAVLAASALDLAPDGERRRLLLAGIIVLTLPLTLYYYNYKVIQTPIREASTWMSAREAGSTTLLLPKDIADNYGEAFTYYLPQATLLKTWSAGRPQPRFVVCVDADTSFVPPEVKTLQQKVYRVPVIAGRAWWVELVSIHQFAIKNLRSAAVRPYRLLAITDLTVDDMGVVDLRGLAPAQSASLKAAWIKSDAAVTGR
jgi:hypothetical protein